MDKKTITGGKQRSKGTKGRAENEYENKTSITDFSVQGVGPGVAVLFYRWVPKAPGNIDQKGCASAGDKFNNNRPYELSKRGF